MDRRTQQNDDMYATKGDVNCRACKKSIAVAGRTGNLRAQAKRTSLVFLLVSRARSTSTSPLPQLLEHRIRLDDRRTPVRNASGVYNNPKEFYGAMPKNFGVQINAERSAYVAEWYSKSAPDPAGTEEIHRKFHWATMK